MRVCLFLRVRKGLSSLHASFACTDNIPEPTASYFFGIRHFEQCRAGHAEHAPQDYSTSFAKELPKRVIQPLFLRFSHLSHATHRKVHPQQTGNVVTLVCHVIFRIFDWIFSISLLNFLSWSFLSFNSSSFLPLSLFFS